MLPPHSDDFLTYLVREALEERKRCPFEIYMRTRKKLLNEELQKVNYKAITAKILFDCRVQAPVSLLTLDRLGEVGTGETGSIPIVQ